MRADQPQADASSEGAGAGIAAVTGDVRSGLGKTARFQPISERERQSVREK